ncbi:M56 family metallopeptidase [Dokdonella soli]|uniref:M56 family metallopeptidase n=1 Tax=Dokdonella soli TaxID=529810 RepID=UPI0031D91DD5
MIRALLPKEHCDARYAAGLSALALLAICPPVTFMALRHQESAALAAGTLNAGSAQVQQIGGTVAAVAGDASFGMEGILPWLVLLWSVGVLIVACRALYQWQQLARVVRHQSAPDARLEAMLADLARRFGFVRRVRVLVSACIDTPTLIGWVKPVVLLPTAVALGFPRQQIELILAHELGHLSRYDHLVNLAQSLLEILFFYHPVVHWISREVRNEREICCDALVLRLTSGVPREYALALAGLEELRQSSVQVALAASGGELLDRVRRIVGMQTPSQVAAKSNSGLWLLVAATLCVTLAGMLRVERDDLAQFTVPHLSIDWLPRSQLEALPIATLPISLSRPHLQLASIAAPRVRPEPAATAPQLGSIDSTQSAVPSAAPAAQIAVIDGPPSMSTVDFRKDLVGASALRAVADLPVSKPVVAATKPETAPTAPVATRIVSPTYPSATWSGSTESVKLEFGVSPNGAVYNVKVLDGDPDSPFARAAERALRQWRFSAASVSLDSSVRYTQTFAFAPRGGQGKAAVEDSGCVQATGTHICRHLGEAATAESVTTVSGLLTSPAAMSR